VVAHPAIEPIHSTEYVYEQHIRCFSYYITKQKKKPYCRSVGKNIIFHYDTPGSSCKLLRNHPQFLCFCVLICNFLILFSTCRLLLPSPRAPRTQNTRHTRAETSPAHFFFLVCFVVYIPICFPVMVAGIVKEYSSIIMSVVLFFFS
jgi:hypothetical protein